MNNTTTIKIDPFSSSTGAGTLGYYANKYGTTVDNLLKLNPTITNKNVIQTGNDLVVPTFNQPSVQTSTKANDAVTAATNYVNGQESSAKYYNANTNDTTTTPKATQDTTTTSSVENTNNPYINNIDVQKINDTYDTYGRNLKTQVDSLVAGLDSDTAAMIQSISNTYAKRITEQKDINNRYLESARVSGYASGRSRYASEMQDGILSKEEQDGLQRINDLEKEREDLILKAKSARDEKSRAALLDYQNQLIEINKQKNQAVKDLFDQTMSIERLGLDKAKDARDTITSNINNSSKMAENLAPSLVDYMDTNTLSKADRDKLITDYADSYGVSEDYLKSAIKNYRLEQSKANPEAIKEYEYYKNQVGYKGSLMDYMRLKKTATTISSGGSSSGGGNIITAADADRFDLPYSLVGQSKKKIILDLKVSTIPQWFKESQAKAGHPADLANWNIFRGTGDMKVLLDEIDTNKAGKDNASSDSSGSYSDL